jgi:hypothetical protein
VKNNRLPPITRNCIGFRQLSLRKSVPELFPESEHFRYEFEPKK